MKPSFNIRIFDDDDDDDDVSVTNACVFQGDGHSAHQFKYKPRRLLHQAATWNNAAMAAVLLSHDADKNARDFNVSSPEFAGSVFSSICCTQRSVVDASQAEILSEQHRQGLLCYCCYDCAASVNEVSRGIEGRWDLGFSFLEASICKLCHSLESRDLQMLGKQICQSLLLQLDSDFPWLSGSVCSALYVCLLPDMCRCMTGNLVSQAGVSTGVHLGQSIQQH